MRGGGLGGDFSPPFLPCRPFLVGVGFPPGGSRGPFDLQ